MRAALLSTETRRAHTQAFALLLAVHHMAAQELLKAALSAWSPVDLSATRHAALDKQGLEIADNQEQSAAGREVLKQKLQEFKKVSAQADDDE